MCDTLQCPEESAVVVPTTFEPLYNVTLLFASAVPTISMDVPLNNAGTVVVMAGELGGVVSTVAVTADVVVVLPAASVAALLKLCTPSPKVPVTNVHVFPLTVAFPSKVVPS